MRFSILIPVYNVERYLAQCIDSVLSQNYDDFEIILSNDGSTDNSPAICEEYAKRDVRVKYYSKQNEGLLLTRRYAIRRAQGEYVLFLDSDDYWKPNLLRTVSDELDINPVDMLLYRFDRIRDDGKLLYVDNGVFANRTLFTENSKELFLKEFVSSSKLNTMWSKCVKRSIIDADYDYSRFADKKGEDLLQSINLIKNAKSILYLDTSLYCYRRSPSGRGRNFKKIYIDDFETVRTHVLSILIEMNVSKNVLDAFYLNYYKGIVQYFRKYASICTDYDEYNQSLSDTLNMHTCAEVLREVDVRVLKGADKWDYFLVKNQHFLPMYWVNRLFLKLSKGIMK